MDQHSSSGEHRRPRQQGPRRSGSRSPSGSRRPSRDSDREPRNRPPRDHSDFRPGDQVSSGPRRPRSGSRAPELTWWQKVVKAITFGAVDFSKKPRKRPASATSSNRPRSESKERGERREPELVEPTSGRLYIGNLSYDVTDDDLAELFGTVGTVVSASVVMQPGGGRSKGFAFVEMATVEEAKAATKLHDRDVQGRRILVTGAKPERSGDRPERSERGERGEGRERSEGRERGERREAREPRERGPRTGGDEKPARQVKAPVIEVVSGPLLQVGPFSSDATDADIQSIFDGIGSVQSRVETPGTTAEQRHFHIELAETSEAQKAVELLDGKAFMGTRLRVTGVTGE